MCVDRYMVELIFVPKNLGHSLHNVLMKTINVKNFEVKYLCDQWTDFDDLFFILYQNTLYNNMEYFVEQYEINKTEKFQCLCI